MCACALEGGVPTHLGQLRRLRFLYLNDNRDLGGKIPTELGNIEGMHVLALSNTNIEGMLLLCLLVDLGSLHWRPEKCTNCTMQRA